MKFHKIAIIFLLLIFVSSLSWAVAPSDEVIKIWKDNGTYETNMNFLRDFKARGGCSPAEHSVLKKKDLLAADANAIDTVKVVVILVDFSDHPWDGQSLAGTPEQFDSILFSDRTEDIIFNETGSMTDFYMENSYGTFYVQGDIKGWYRMPHTYAEYALGYDGLGQFGMHSGLPNAQDLAYDAVTAADNDGVDFSQYDFNGDGDCDGFILIHSGPGAEVTSNVGDIWSHKWNLRSTRNVDGVNLSNYNINPEEYGSGPGTELSPIGVFCHEYGHFLALPDLYDTQDNPGSEGLGRWSLMASGNYNGNSRTPGHFDAWCKSQLGFVNVIDVTTNMANLEIPQIEDNPIIYKLQNPDTQGEYWLVENRQQTKFDTYLPGEGLLIYHIDESAGSNTDPFNYMVALEQADNLNELAFDGSRGNTGDPYPGSTNNRAFHRFTAPSSNTYLGVEQEIGVWGISDSDSIMTVDLDVSYSRPWIVTSGANPITFDDSFNGDGDGLLEPGETVRVFFSIRNDMRFSNDLHVSLTSNNSGLNFTNNNITIPQDPFSFLTVTNNANPIEFIIPDTLTPHIDSFFLNISTDSLSGIPGNKPEYSKTFELEITLGAPIIMIVDDDRGDDLDLVYAEAFYSNKNPISTWEVQSQGVPTIGDLNGYDMVFWHTGDSTSGVIDAARIVLMKQFMDGGGNLLLSTFGGIKDIATIDPAFMSDYFQAADNATFLTDDINGVDGNDISDGLHLTYRSDMFYWMESLTPVGLGVPFLTGHGPEVGSICGVSYEGTTHKSVLMSFGLEAMNKDIAYYNNHDLLISKVVDFFGGTPTAIYDGTGYPQLPKSFSLNQNYPNPFNPSTTIEYTIRSTEAIGQKIPPTKLEIFNILGQNIRTLVDEVQKPGFYNVEWDGADQNGHKVSSGIYFYRLTRGENNESKKMTLLK